MAEDVKIIAGRNCNGCSMCCKLPAVPEFDKPRLEWCRHCNPTKGCKIYDQRPSTCRDFYCGYLIHPDLDEAWKPSRSKLMLTFEPYAHRVTIHVDPSRPDAWRQEPFYSRIKRWAVRAAGERGQVLVWVGKRTIAILPHTDKDLGEVREDQYIVTNEKLGDVYVVDADHPTAQRLRDQTANPAD